MSGGRGCIAGLLAGFMAVAPWGTADAVRAERPGDVTVAALAAATPVPDPAAVAPRPRQSDAGERRCTADGAACIRLASYVPDVCGVIEAASRAHALDPHFFARLIWQESRFDAAAISPAGAQGIAQFMPGTAQLRGLADPFNPAEALAASARYLAEMARGYGNIGLAAIAYNGGEARAERFIARNGGLPAETRAYVATITGHSAETWRDAPPTAVDLALATDSDFRTACIAQAEGRSLRGFRTAPVLRPWGVIVASARDRAGAERQAGRLRHRHAAVLGGEDVMVAEGRAPGLPRRLHMAQVGRDSRAEADALCARLRAAGGDCMVLRN